MGGIRTFVVVLVTASILGMTMATSGASASPGWQGVVRHPNPAQVEDLRLAINDYGSAAVAWNSPNPGGYGHNLSYAKKEFYGWTRSLNAVDNVSSFDLALMNNGGVHVAYSRWNGTAHTLVLCLACHPLGGGFELVLNSSASPMEVLDLLSDGWNFTVIWKWFDGSRNHLAASTHFPNGTYAGPSAVEGGDGSVTLVATSANGAGIGAVTWSQNEGATPTLWTSVWTASAGWGPAHRVANQTRAEEAAVAVEPSGAVMVIWLEHNLTSDGLWHSRYDGGSWSGRMLISSSPKSWAVNLAVVAGGGSVLASWSTLVSSDPLEVEFQTWRFDHGASRWGDLQVAARNTNSGFVSAGGDGSVVALLWHGIGLFPPFHYDFVRAGPDGSWRAPEHPPAAYQPSPSVGGAQIAVNGTGVVTIAWLEEANGVMSVATTTYVPDDLPPSILITAPSEGLVVEDPAVMVQGITEPGVVLTVGGIRASVEIDGTFAFPMPLRPGTNWLNITAEDSFGNAATVGVNVTYSDPEAGLAARLAEAEANVTAALAQLGSAQADLAAAQADLVRAKGELANLTIEWGAIAANLSAALSEQMATQARLDALEAKENASAEEIADARANLSAAQASVGALQEEQASLLAAINVAATDAAVAADRIASTAEQLSNLSAELNATRQDLAEIQAEQSAAEREEAADRAATSDARAAAENAGALAAAGLLLGAAGVGAAMIALIRSRRPPEGASRGEASRPRPRFR